MRRLVLTVALVLSANCAHAAADITLSAGASVTVGLRWTEAVFLDAGTHTHEWAGVHWQPTATLGWIGSRSDRTDHLDHDVLIAGAGVRLVDWWGGAFLGFEGAYVDQRTDALSSHGQFITSFGWQGDRLTFFIRHISNGNLFGGRNLGETMLLAGLRF
jgi:hypothetical protein